MEQLFEGVGPVFWIIATVLLVSGFMVVSLKNIFHSALFLILCLFSVAGIFLLLEAEFLAAAQVLIYVGAVAILIIFAIMLTGNLASRRIRQLNENVLVGFFVSVVFVFAGVLL
ncbi:MAG TPA: NADH-quinone oxidoreductase subunit J, partial [candidate division Zixibacteria bacterium]|nr:NADH-quinone oxidoreductase subunit J [candidate division Zixibacteria bacterium]